jgi:hypothetical protein
MKGIKLPVKELVSMSVLPFSPHIAACEELISMIDAPRAIYAQNVETESQLRELWEIDKAAYADCSLEFEPFLEWWQRYEYGSRNLVLAGKIIASIGIYPLYADQASAFASGEIREGDLKPVLLEECEREKVSHWYCSGIVVIPELQNRGLLKSLLQIGLGAWSATGHIQYPLTIYGLAEYKIGEKLFKKFGFKKAQDKAALPDKCDLYKTEISSVEQLEAQLHARGF